MANLRHAFEEHGKKTLTLGVEMPWMGYRQSEGNHDRLTFAYNQDSTYQGPTSFDPQK